MSDIASLLEIQRRSFAEASAGLRAAWPERQALNAAQLEDLLRRHRYAILATSRRDGRPHAAPVSFVVHAGAFWIATVEGLRLRNFRHTPWASLVLMEGQGGEDEAGEVTHRALTIEGPVSLHESDAFERALEPITDTWMACHRHPPDWAAALVELRPTRLLSHVSIAD